MLDKLFHGKVEANPI